MTRAAAGNTVRFHYTGSVGDGTVFDSSIERDPLQVKLGAGQVIPGVDQALTGMAPATTRRSRSPPTRPMAPIARS